MVLQERETHQNGADLLASLDLLWRSQDERAFLRRNAESSARGALRLEQRGDVRTNSRSRAS